MFTRNVSSIGIALALLLSFAAHAEGKRYLVQFKSTQTFKAVSQNIAKTRLSSPLFATKNENVKLFGANAAVNESLQHLDMLVVESTDAKAMESLRNHPAIALVEEEIIHPAPKQIATFGSVGVSSLSPLLAMPNPWGIDAVRAPQAWAVSRGNGVRVLVLDTGIDSQHGNLSGRYEKGRNFSGGSADNMTDNVGHGSHVAGTVLADGLNGGLVGVAPEARLLMGKVCEANGCSSVAIASGINWSIEENVDVVNMSLGGFFISAGERAALDRAEAAGVLVVAASGNNGSGSVSFPAAYGQVLAIGAVDSALVKADFSQYGPELDLVAPGVDVISAVPRGTGRGTAVKLDDGKGLTDVLSMPLQGSPLFGVQVREVVYAGLGKPADFTANMSGKFALISRGEITFKEKVDNAIARGAAGVIIFNNAPGLIQGGLTEDGSEVSIPAVMVEQAAGVAVRDALAAGQSLSASIAVELSDFASFAGTSMASPHVAGVAALVLGANPNLTPAQVREILKGTATPLSPNNRNEYGSGLVNAEAAVARAQTTGGLEILRRVAN